MSYLGDFEPGRTLYQLFTTPDGLLVGGAATVYRLTDNAESTAGVSLTPNYDGVPTQNKLAITFASDGVFYANGHDYGIVLSAGTVLGVSFAGRDLYAFSIGNRSSRMDWAAVRNASSVVNLSGVTIKAVTDQVTANVLALNGSLTALQNLAAASSGMLIGTTVAGTLSTTQFTTNLTAPGPDHYKNRVVVWLSGPLAFQAARVLAYDFGAGGRFTTTVMTQAPGAGNSFILV